jgi:putative Holliday junction resolvase
MAVDYGIKRVGLAVSDPLQIIATPLQTVANAQLMDYLQNYLQTEEVECLVVGKPTHRDGTPTPLEGHIKGFIRRFRKLYPAISIERQDEAYTSVMAEALLRESTPKKKDRRDKGLIDQMSAYVILREYMGIY